jgi:hypothetical protein
MVSPEQFAHVLEKGMILTLDAFNKLGINQKIKADNAFASEKAGVAIVEAESQKGVSRQLKNFPRWCRVNWSVTPL